MTPRRPHDQLFLEHYGQLDRWSKWFSGGDREAAEDLLHDTFVRLAVAAPDLRSVEDREAFLFVMMRNLHLSRRRRDARTLGSRSALVTSEDEMAAPPTHDPRRRFRARDELRAVCEFACARKERSKQGSLLILRFFHGYHPEEIASVMRTTRTAVNAALKKVRSDARRHLEEPPRRTLSRGEAPAPSRRTNRMAGSDFILELRDRIFASRRGTCPAPDALQGLYSAGSSAGPDRHLLAHIVSCETCIDAVNSLLGLAPLSRRHPSDAIGRAAAVARDPGEEGALSGSQHPRCESAPESSAGGGADRFGIFAPVRESLKIERNEAHFFDP